VAVAPPFSPAAIGSARLGGHNGRLGISYVAHGDDWIEMLLPYRADLIGDPETGVLASGPIVSLMDMASSLAVWTRRRMFVPHATLDLRVDYLRPATPGRAVTGHAECYAIKRAISFVRGTAHDGDPADPVAHLSGTFMTLEAQP
jgi:uncharacterized protein (TIGR00369 family)